MGTTPFLLASRTELDEKYPIHIGVTTSIDEAATWVDNDLADHFAEFGDDYASESQWQVELVYHGLASGRCPAIYVSARHGRPTPDSIHALITENLGAELAAGAA